MRRIAYALVALVLACLALPGSASAADRLDTAFQDPLDTAFHEPDAGSAYAVAHAAGASVVRVPVVWGNVSPKRPADPTNPDDPAYDWSSVDGRVASIQQAGMDPLVVLYAAPRWARRREPDRKRSLAPHTAPFAAFAAATARRYDGTRAPLGRVRYFEIWNEPNLGVYFSVRLGPQRYRALLNAAYRAIHGVAADNVVVAGGLGPFGGGPSAGTPPRFKP